MNKQNSLITRYCLAAAAMLALLGPLAQKGRGNFILWNDEQLTVNSFHNEGTLYDTSRAFIVPGGVVGGNLYAYNYSMVDISGGYIGVLWTFDSSAVAVSGGFVHFLYPYDSSEVGISGGEVDHLWTHDSIAVAISGGFVESLITENSSDVDISGGQLTRLRAYDSSTVTFYGQNFLVSGGLVFDGNRVLGIGILSGNWMDGAPWAVDIDARYPTTTILAIPIPAPGALVLAGIGVSCLTWLRRRRTL